MARDIVYDMMRENGRQQHAERVQETPDRLEFAIRMLEKNDICYTVKNTANGHIHAWRKADDQLMQYWAGTGKILGKEQRGIHNFIGMLNGRSK